MTRRQRRRDRGERGQALVEFSLVSIIFFFLVFGIIDFGLGLHSWISVTNAAREGARVGAVQAPSDGSLDCNPLPEDGSIELKLCETAANLDPEKISITVTNAQGDPGDAITVAVDYEYDLITPLANLLQSTLTLSSSTQMRLE
ncbi:MAG: TadE family protein [Dehalococcoidia bacterium]